MIWTDVVQLVSLNLDGQVFRIQLLIYLLLQHCQMMVFEYQLKDVMREFFQAANQTTLCLFHVTIVQEDQPLLLTYALTNVFHFRINLLE